MDYTPHQKRLLKARFYRWVLNASTGTQLNWKNAAQTLAEIAGLSISPETLRQNFQPVSAKQGRSRREFSDPARWQALHRFLVAPQIAYLTERLFGDRRMVRKGLTY